MQDNFQKFKKVPLLLSLLFLLFSGFSFLFLHREIKNNSKISEQTQIAWQGETNKREELKSLNDSLKKTEQERTLLESYFIKSSDIVPFLDTIEKLAPKVEAKAEIVLVDIPKNSSGLIAEIKVTGAFEALYKFLTLLENSPYELDFISIDIQKSNGENVFDKENSFSQWSAVFRVKLLNFVQ